MEELASCKRITRGRDCLLYSQIGAEFVASSAFLPEIKAEESLTLPLSRWIRMLHMAMTQKWDVYGDHLVWLSWKMVEEGGVRYVCDRKTKSNQWFLEFI